MTGEPRPQGPLTGLRILELGDEISAPYCGKLLRAMGAEVLKVEPPAGDGMRGHGPFPADRRGDTDARELGGLFAYLNAGKRSLVLNLDHADAGSLLADLALACDAVVTNWPLGRLATLGLDHAALSQRDSRAVFARLSVFGSTGPWASVPAQDLQAQAASGVAWGIGDEGREPLTLPLQQGEYQAGAHGAAALLTALIARDRQGTGQDIDISSADVLSYAAGTNALIYRHYGLLRWGRAGPRAIGSGGPYPYVILPCKDGSVCLIGRARREWEQLVKAMGDPPWSREPRYQDLKRMGSEYPEEVDRLLTPWLMQHTRAELLEIAGKFSFPLGPLRPMSEVVRTEQFVGRDYFPPVAMADGAARPVPALPFRFSRSGVDTAPPPPRLGQDTDQSLAAVLGLDHAATDRLRQNGVIPA